MTILSLIRDHLVTCEPHTSLLLIYSMIMVVYQQQLDPKLLLMLTDLL